MKYCQVILTVILMHYLGHAIKKLYYKYSRYIKRYQN